MHFRKPLCLMCILSLATSFLSTCSIIASPTATLEGDLYLSTREEKLPFQNVIVELHRAIREFSDYNTKAISQTRTDTQGHYSFQKVKLPKDTHNERLLLLLIWEHQKSEESKDPCPLGFISLSVMQKNIIRFGRAFFSLETRGKGVITGVKYGLPEKNFDYPYHIYLDLSGAKKEFERVAQKGINFILVHKLEEWEKHAADLIRMKDFYLGCKPESK